MLCPELIKVGYNQRLTARGYRLIWREGSMQSCWATTSIRFVHFQMIRRGFSRPSYACVWRRSPIVVTTFLLVKRALLEWRVQISSCASHSSAKLFSSRFRVYLSREQSRLQCQHISMLFANRRKRFFVPPYCGLSYRGYWAKEKARSVLIRAEHPKIVQSAAYLTD